MDRRRIGIEPAATNGILVTERPQKFRAASTGLIALVVMLFGVLEVATVHAEEAAKLVEDGKRQLAQSDAGAAADSLAKATELDPQHEPAQFWLGRSRYLSGDWAGAVDAFARSVALAQGSAATRYWLGRALFEDGRIQDAIEAFENAANNAPEFAAPRFWHGRALFRRLNDDPAALASALSSLELAATIDPTAGETHLWLADARLRAGDRPGVRAAIAAALRFAMPVWEFDAALGRLLLALDDPEPAVGHLATALLTAPTDAAPRLRLTLGQALVATHRYADAISELEMAVRAEPALLGDAQFWLGRAHCADGEGGRGVPFLQDFIAVREDAPEPHYWLGRCHFARAAFDDAEAAFRQATDLRPDSAEYWFWLGRTEWWRREYPAAIEAVEAAISREPLNPAYYIYLAVAHEARGDIVNAATAYSQLATEAGDHFRGEAGLRRLAQLAPASGIIVSKYAEVLMSGGRFAEAAIALDQQDGLAASADTQRAWALLGSRRLEDADAAVDAALSVATNEPWNSDPLAFEALGWLRIAQGRPDEALYVFEILDSLGDAMPARHRTGVVAALIDSGGGARVAETEGPFSRLGLAVRWLGGARVFFVTEGGPGAKAGVIPGDLILSIDDVVLARDQDWDLTLPRNATSVLKVVRREETLLLPVQSSGDRGAEP